MSALNQVELNEKNLEETSAKSKSKFITLDESERELSVEDLMICLKYFFC